MPIIVPLHKRPFVLLALIFMFLAYCSGRLAGLIVPEKGETWKKETQSFFQCCWKAIGGGMDLQ